MSPARGSNVTTSTDRDTLSNLSDDRLVASLHKGGFGPPCAVVVVGRSRNTLQLKMLNMSSRFV